MKVTKSNGICKVANQEYNNEMQSNHSELTDARSSSFRGTKASGVVMHSTCSGIEKGSHLLSSSHWHTASGQGTTPF